MWFSKRKTVKNLENRVSLLETELTHAKEENKGLEQGLADAQAQHEDMSDWLSHY